MDATLKLEKELKVVEGSKKLKILLKLSQTYLNISLEKSLDYGNQALELSEKIKSDEGKSKSLSVIGLGYYHHGSYERSLNYFLKSLQIFEKINDKSGVAQITKNIGRVYRSLGNYDKGLDYLLRSLELMEEINDKRGIANSLNGIGLIYIKLNDNDKALEYLLKSLRIYEDTNDKIGSSKVINNIGIVYWNEERFRDALEYFLKSLKIDEELGDKKAVASSLNNIGLLYTKLKDNEKVLEYYLKALRIREEIGDKSEIATSAINISSLYIETKDFRKASEYMDIALKLSEEINSKDLIADTYYCFFEFYNTKKDFHKALEYFKKYSDIKGKIFTKQISEQIAEIQTRHEAEKKEKEAEIYRLKNVELEKVRKDLEIKNEEIKKQRNQLNQLNKDKDKFFSIVTHDLKSPFTGLLGFSEVLASRLDDLTKEEVKDLSVDLHNAARSVFNLLENLLQWSRIQTGQIKSVQGNYDLKELVENSINLFNANAVKKKIKITSDIDSGLKVFVDKKMIEAVIRNLLSNAIKFTQKEGSIYISSKNINGFVSVSVKDTGAGMDKEELSKIFKIGEQVSTLGTESERGSGLGLIICKEFVEKNNGKLSVESEKEKGSVFSFMVPLGK